MNKLKLITYSCLITLSFLSCLQNIYAEQLNFTPKEKTWLSQHHTVRARVGGSPPLHFYDGKFKGISVEYLDLIAKRVGFEVQYITDISWSTALESIKNHQELDLILTAKNTSERQKMMVFTDDYLLMPYGIFCRNDNNTITTIENLNFKKVSVEQNYVIHKKLITDYPNIRLIVKKTSKEAIQAVALGEADAYIGNLTTTSYIIQKNNLTNLKVTAPTPFENHNQAMAIRDDWPELASIINKTFGALSQEEHKIIQEKWSSTAIGQNDAIDHLTPSDKKSNELLQKTPFWRSSAYGLVIFLVISLFFWFLRRSIKKEHISIKYGSTWFRLIVLTGLSLFLLIVFMIGWINLEKSRKTHLEDVNQNLNGVLSILQDRMELWLVERKSFMKQLGFNPELATLTKRLLAVTAEKNVLIPSKELADIRSFFKKSKDMFPNIGFFIINSNYISIGSRRDANLGTLNLISKQYPDLLKKAFQGEVGFVPPIPSDVHLGTSKGVKKPPTMFFIGPVRDLDSKVLAVFTLRVDPWRDFSEVVNSLRYFDSSEIYAFDKSGCLLTTSRFDEQLQRIGLLDKNEASPLNIEIRDPGVNMLEEKRPKRERSKQPLTRMVQSVLALKADMEQTNNQQNHSKIESSIIPYRDYRGVPVYGAWSWNNNLQIGLTSEIDVEEALDHYYQTRLMVFSILGFTLFMSVGAVLLVLVLGERASRALTKSRDDLEDEVEKRTAELEMNRDQLKGAEEWSRLLLESAGEGIFGVNTDGKINFVNPSALNLLGYSESEMLGTGAHQLIHHSHGDGTHYDATECPMYHSFAYGKSGKVTDEVLWRKNGSQFDVEYSSTPIKKEGKIIGAVITFLDVTERKKAEMEAAIAKENLDLALKSANMGTWKYYVPENRLEADDNTKKLYGLEQVELDGSMEQWFTFVHPEDVAPIGEIMQHTMTNQIIDYKTSFRIVMPENQVRHILSVGKFSYDKKGNAISTSGLVWDITDIKVMEEALIAEKSHLQKVLDTSPVGVAISVGGIMRFANPKILELLDLKLDDPAPQFYVNTEDRDHIMATLKNHGMIEGYELQMIARNKEIKDMLVTYMTISYEKQDAVLGWVMDITELKKTDRELRQQFDEMSRFRKLAVGRELKMVEIKKEINNLLLQQDKKPIYKIVK